MPVEMSGIPEALAPYNASDSLVSEKELVGREGPKNADSEPGGPATARQSRCWCLLSQEAK